MTLRGPEQCFKDAAGSLESEYLRERCVEARERLPGSTIARQAICEASIQHPLSTPHPRRHAKNKTLQITEPRASHGSEAASHALYTSLARHQALHLAQGLPPLLLLTGGLTG